MRRIRRTVKELGPGFVTGASDDDPAGIATYSQTGAQFGYQQVWAAPFSFPFMTVVQEMSGRIGIVTGRGLASVMRTHYPQPILWGGVATLLVANIINIGANLGAMAASTRLIVDIPFISLLLAFTFGTLLVQVFVPYHSYVRVLKYLALSLGAYILTAFAVNQEWHQIFRHMVLPTLSLERAFLLNIVAILGTTISPYLFFWQASEEAEENVRTGKMKRMGWGRPHINMRDIRRMRRDTIIGMLLSNVVMFFIIITAASTLGAAGITTVETADQAAAALEPLAGRFASLLFALGIIGTGLLAVPILAGSVSYAVAEMFRWKSGLSLRAEKAVGFYTVLAAATFVGLFVNFLPIEPFRLLYFTAVLNGFAAPPIIIMMLFIANNKKIMGKYTNGWFSNMLGWGIVLIMGGSALMLLASLVGLW
ncbi:MAG: Nramp family divalent metal transporter [Candidatus Spechtbacterales bacterium]